MIYFYIKRINKLENVTILNKKLINKFLKIQNLHTKIGKLISRNRESIRDGLLLIQI
jgi:hypothetical protein